MAERKGKKQLNKASNNRTKNTAARKTGKTKKSSGGRSVADGRSATLKAIERQKKLENTMPLASLTAELPFLGPGDYDAPSRKPWKSVEPARSRGGSRSAESGRRRRRREFNLKDALMSNRLLVIVLFLILALIIAALVVISIYTVDTVIIEGNAHYTNEEIYDMVISDQLSKSSIFLSMKYKNKDIEDIPFIQTMNVKIVNPSTIKIVVYEKAMAGFVEYMGRYFYFDKDGTVVESSEVRTKGIPQIMGLEFDHVVLYDRLPVDSDDIFKEILEVTQLLSKHEMDVDKIYFDSNYDITLYFNDARVKLGNFDNIDEKVIRLKAILPELSDKKGVLRLDNYDGSDNIITFEKDK